MSKKTNFLIVVVFVAIFSMVYYFSNRCVLDGETVCYNEKIGQFDLEENAHLKIHVESEEVAEQFKKLWAQEHPKHADKVELFVAEPKKIKEMVDGPGEDIVLINQNNAAYFMDQYHDLGEKFEELVGQKIPPQLYDAMNEQGFYFLPNTISGWVFVYNPKVLESLGYDTTYNLRSGLPQGFETWEKIFSKSPELLKELDYVFPITFKDQDSFYPFLTSGKWTLNFQHSVSGFGFKTREFNEGLAFIEFLRNVEITKGKEKSSDLEWAYDKAFYERKTAFSLMHASFYRKDFADEMVIAPFPTFNGHQMSPMGEVNGYVVMKKSSFPSASAEALRILRSPEMMSEYVSSDGKEIIYHRNYFDDLDLSKDRLQSILAYNFHDTESVLALKENPKVRLKNVYYEVDFMDILQEFYDGEIDRDKAQAMIVKRAEKWIVDHGGQLEDVEKSN